jgi:succinyl-CoA synthetase beta subunit
MNIHEYQAKALLKDYGVAILHGQVAYTPEDAEAAARELGGPIWVVKAQIHAGGRGKGGGVKLARSVEEVRQLANQMLGMTLVTHQTGPAGRQVRRGYVEDGCEIARELYLGVVIDRAASRVTFMASTEGGVEIEEVAARTPEKIIRVAIDPATGFQPFHGRQIAFGLGLEGKQVSKAVGFVRGVSRAFTELDASLLEINPLVVTAGGDLVAPTRSRRAGTSSTTSSSTATSVAWSTAPGSRWRRWTSSSSTAARRPTSSTSAAAPPRSG